MNQLPSRTAALWPGVAIWAGVVLAGLYVAFVLWLVLSGRRGQARAVAGFLPDCAVLVGRIARDPAVPRRRRASLWLVAAYLAMPIDLVPDFIPVLGYADDAIITTAVLRSVIRKAGVDAVRRHWPGTEDGFAVLMRFTRRRR
jgi:uncharacterized membrane protein YkvA (DUF1232 family)